MNFPENRKCVIWNVNLLRCVNSYEKSHLNGYFLRAPLALHTRIWNMAGKAFVQFCNNILWLQISPYNDPSTGVHDSGLRFVLTLSLKVIFFYVPNGFGNCSSLQLHCHT